MFHTILNAKRRVWLSTYIFSADRTGYLTIKHLKKARENGCEIVIIFDSIGSSIKEHHLNELRQAGALLYEFNPFTKAEHWWDWRKRLGHPYKRNHQKILICDDVGFCGGMNIGNEYADIKPVGENFRDTHLKIEGPAVRDLQHAFIDCLSEVKDTYGIDEIHNNIVANFKKEPSIPPFQDGSTVQVLQSNVWQNHRAIQRAKRLTMLYAKERCYLTTPYFLPPLLLRNAITRAARRGVDVRILTAGRSDVKTVRKASQYVYASFLKYGVRIFEFHGDKILHAKTASVDGSECFVGSFNLDWWSSGASLESVVLISDVRIASQLDEQFELDLKACKEVTLENLATRTWLDRFWCWCCYAMLYVLRPPFVKNP